MCIFRLGGREGTRMQKEEGCNKIVWGEYWMGSNFLA